MQSRKEYQMFCLFRNAHSHAVLYYSKYWLYCIPIARVTRRRKGKVLHGMNWNKLIATKIYFLPDCWNNLKFTNFKEVLFIKTNSNKDGR